MKKIDKHSIDVNVEIKKDGDKIRLDESDPIW